MKKLTVTSYAILSLLGMRNWSAYELTQQMHRNVGLYWPRAERGIYDEVKNLVEHQLAGVDEQTHGRRPRSVYRITPAGRAALRAWLASPVTAPMALESETVLRVAFGENGTPQDLLAALAGIRELVAEQAALIANIGRQYSAGAGPYPERIHVIGLVMSFLVEHLKACDGWAQWAGAEIAGWSAASMPTQPDRARDIVAEATARAEALTSADTGGTARAEALTSARTLAAPPG